MAALASSGRDLFLKYQGTGSSSVVCHRVWDAERFFRSQQTAGLKDPKDITLVTLSTSEEYRTNNWSRK